MCASTSSRNSIVWSFKNLFFILTKVFQFLVIYAIAQRQGSCGQFSTSKMSIYIEASPITSPIDAFATKNRIQNKLKLVVQCYDGRVYLNSPFYNV